MTLGCSGTLNNAIDGNEGYQYGVNISSGGPVTIDHCDIWGFGNAIVFYSTTAQMTATSNWIHDAANGTYSATPAGAAISGFSQVSGDTYFFTSTQSYSLGQNLVLYGFSGSAAGLNGLYAQVSTTGGSSFQAELSNSCDYFGGSVGPFTTSGAGHVQSAGQCNHTDGPGYLNGGTGPTNVLIQGNTIASLGNTNGIAFQGATGGYSDIQIVSNYVSGFGYTVATGVSGGGNVDFSSSVASSNVFGTDVAPLWNPLYSDASWLSGTGNAWVCNIYSFRSGTTWTDGDSWTPPSSINGLYWWPTTTTASTSDYSSNTICPSLGPSSLAWKFQTVGSTSSSQSVTLTNTNTGTITITSIALQTGAQFSLTNDCGSSLAPNASCTITAKFKPTAIGPQADNILITDNATAPSSPQMIPLLGIGRPQ